MKDDFQPQGPDFDLNKFIGDTHRPFKKRFYCPSCGEKVIFHLINEMEDDNYDCPTCQGIMLLEEDDSEGKEGGKEED